MFKKIRSRTWFNNIRFRT